MIMTAHEFGKLAAMLFDKDWPGLGKRQEGRHGDTRYSHAALKYMNQARRGGQDPQVLQLIHAAWQKAFLRACELAVEMGLPLPDGDDSTLRILEYAPGASFDEHTDFCLFTVNLFRNYPNGGIPDTEVHIGQLGAMYGYDPTPHSVHPREWGYQYSAVFFAMPRLDLVLPNGRTVRQQVEMQKTSAEGYTKVQGEFAPSGRVNETRTR
jgi:hypothetical protein